MSTPKVLILRAPGTNCDWETQFAFEQAGATCERIHINRLLEQPTLADAFQILCIPGGFSYGDDVAAGRILATQMQTRLAEQLHAFRDAEKLMLGICNGFQVLVKSGLFDRDTAAGSSGGNSLNSTLTWNNHGRFEDRWVNLKRHSDACVFLQGIEQLYLPMAHAEGKFVTRDPDTMKLLRENDQIALTYCLPDGTNGDSVGFPYNPNGSEMNIAGICDSTGRVFGLMPHPERFIDRTQHPRWTRQTDYPIPDGQWIFKNAVAFFN